jgi:hypothetical protein
MSLFKPSTWGTVRVYRDLENYSQWIKTIKKEEASFQSKYTKWELKHNKFYTLYFFHTIDENEAQLPEQIKRLRIIESLAPLNRYLDQELGYAECLIPEFNQFYDTEGNPTLTYLIAYRFAFNKLSMGWALKKLIEIIALIIFLAHFSPILTWIKHLI